MTIELIIDNREHHLIEELQKTDQVFTIAQLELGDVVFKNDTEIVLRIERKTINDFKASICDGRNREQKTRLLGSGTSVDRIMYIIEGDLSKSLDTKVSGLPISTLLGSIINTQLRDNIKVYKTLSLFETSEYIRKLFDKLSKDIDNYFQEGEKKVSASQYSTTLKTSKKANMTPEVWFITQLSLIPQVTDKIAAEVVNKYSTFVNLFREYETTPQHLKEKLLSDITYPIASGKTRRVGDKVSKRIYEFVYGIQIQQQVL
jgi:ERCC4-type nuclease